MVLTIQSYHWHSQFWLWAQSKCEVDPDHKIIWANVLLSNFPHFVLIGIIFNTFCSNDLELKSMAPKKIVPLHFFWNRIFRPICQNQSLRKWWSDKSAETWNIHFQSAEPIFPARGFFGQARLLRPAGGGLKKTNVRFLWTFPYLMRPKKQSCVALVGR